MNPLFATSSFHPVTFRSFFIIIIEFAYCTVIVIFCISWIDIRNIYYILKICSSVFIYFFFGFFFISYFLGMVLIRKKNSMTLNRKSYKDKSLNTSGILYRQTCGILLQTAIKRRMENLSTKNIVLTDVWEVIKFVC